MTKTGSAPAIEGSLTIENVVRCEQETIEKTKAADKVNILISRADQLFIDLDDVKKHTQFVQGLELISERICTPTLEAWPSKSDNIHVVLSFDNDFKPRDQILWQLMLGSDPERERWGLVKRMRGVEDFNRLFQPKGNKPVPILLWCNRCDRLICPTHKRYMDDLRDADRGWRCTECDNDRCKVIE